MHAPSAGKEGRKQTAESGCYHTEPSEVTACHGEHLLPYSETSQRPIPLHHVQF